MYVKPLLVTQKELGTETRAVNRNLEAVDNEWSVETELWSIVQIFGLQSDLVLEFETEGTRPCLSQDSARHLGLDEGCYCCGQRTFFSVWVILKSLLSSIVFSDRKNLKGCCVAECCWKPWGLDDNSCQQILIIGTELSTLVDFTRARKRAVPRVSKLGAEEHDTAVRQEAQQLGPILPSQASRTY